MFKPGDIVIGSSDPSKSVYSATGSKITDNSSSLYGTEDELQQIEKDYLNSITRNGGKKIVEVHNSSSKKTKKLNKSANTSFQNPAISSNLTEAINLKISTSVPEENYTIIQFENAFGKIKAKALHVANHEQAIMLIFKNEEEVLFEPKVGENLQIVINKYTKHNVYYPGVTFNSPFDDKRFMILFKVPEETIE
jgi:hypothetical protein